MAKEFIHRVTDTINSIIDTTEPAQSAGANQGTLEALLSRLANRLKTVTGKATWWEPPSVTLEDTASHIGNSSNPHGVSASQVGAITSVDGVSNAGGNVDLAASNSITISPDDATNTVTIGESHSALANNPHGTTATQVGAPPTNRAINTSGALSGGGDLTADRTLAVASSSETQVGVVELATAAETQTGTDSVRAVHPAGLKSVTDGKVNSTDARVGSVDGVAPTAGGNVDLIAGTNVTITPNNTNKTITINADASGAAAGVGSVDGVTPASAGGNIDLVAGANVTITPNDSADTITIAASTGTGSVSNASGTVAGISKLSLNPVTSTDPIALGVNDGRVLTQGENDAAQGTTGTPSNTNRFVTNDDTRNTNARTPTAHTHAIGDIPVAASGVSNTTTVVRADDSRLADSRTPTAHTHAIGDLPVATSGTSNSTQVVRADDTRLVRLKDIALYQGKEILQAGDNTGQYPILRGGTIHRIVGRAVNAPAGSALVMSIRKNGTEVHSMSIAAGTNVTNATGLSIAVADNDYVSFTVTGVGSTTAGGRITVVCEQILS